MLSLISCCSQQGFIFLPISGGLYPSCNECYITRSNCCCHSKRVWQRWEQSDGDGYGSCQISFVKSKQNGKVCRRWFINKHYQKFTWVSTCLSKGAFLSLSLFIFSLLYIPLFFMQAHDNTTGGFTEVFFKFIFQNHIKVFLNSYFVV